jgi:hypothetical protein
VSGYASLVVHRQPALLQSGEVGQGVQILRRGLDLCMAHPVHHPLEVGAAGEQPGRMGVAEVVDPGLGAAGPSTPSPAHGQCAAARAVGESPVTHGPDRRPSRRSPSRTGLESTSKYARSPSLGIGDSPPARRRGSSTAPRSGGQRSLRAPRAPTDGRDATLKTTSFGRITRHYPHSVALHHLGPGRFGLADHYTV